MFGGFSSALLPLSTRVGPLFDVALPGLPALQFGGLFDQFETMQGFGPRLHVHESENNLLLEFEVPRYKKEELTVTAKDDVITVAGKRALQREDGRVVLFQESPLTEFSRSFRIPYYFDLSKHQTSLDMGVLTITIPRVVEQPPKKIEVAAPQPSATPANATTTVATASEGQIDSMSKMRWPPTIKVNDTAETLEYVCSLPEFITKDNIKLAVNRGALEFSVGHTQNVEKKDSKGAVVYQSQQSVNYSTPLALPRGTEVGDISTKFENGVLSVKVNKHANPSQSVSVSH